MSEYLPNFGQPRVDLATIVNTNAKQGACHSPWSKAATATMISTAFPKDAFNNPARVGPNGLASCSVASPRSFTRRLVNARQENESC